MAQLRAFSIIGDSNVKRNMVSTTTSGRPPLSSAQVLICGRLSLFQASLDKVRADADACILACVSNFISGPVGVLDPGSSISSHIEEVLTGFFSKVVAFCHTRPSTFIFLCSPMYRTSPIWYRDALPDILCQFSQIYNKLEERPHNLLQLSSFSKIQLEADGVHLTPFSGMSYILHLFDTAQEVRDALELPAEARMQRNESKCLAVEDRMLVIERDHSRLNRKFEL